MASPNLINTDLVKKLALAQIASKATMQFAGMPKGTLRGLVVDVDDPENLGRVRVRFKEFDPDTPQVEGAGEFSERRIGEEPEISHWIDTSPAFKGKQPQGLVGKEVNVVASYGQYQYAILTDVLNPSNTTKKGAKQIPNNSPMTRLPCYESGSLPPASAENVGCIVVECGGPLQSDWLCVCLQRNGQYYWVRHIDASHGHAGQNDSTEKPDTDGDAMAPINNAAIWDYTFPTTAEEMNKYSSYGTDPRPNPYGGEATWIGGAK